MKLLFITQDSIDSGGSPSSSPGGTSALVERVVVVLLYSKNDQGS